MDTTANSRPALEARDDRKSAGLASARSASYAGTRMTKGFAGAREVLRSAGFRQAGGIAAQLVIDNPDHVSFFFLDGEVHRKRRASVAGYFTPKAIVSRYHPIIERTMDDLITRLRAEGSGSLDEMALAVATKVTAEILGVVNDGDPLDMARRLHASRRAAPSPHRGRWTRFVQDRLLGWHFRARRQRIVAEFYDRHIAPAVEARRREPRDDVISYMVAQGYSKPSMIMECMTYGTAGVSTTREFIGMAAWHLFDRPDLLQTFLACGEEGQFAILQEILRIDPVSGMLYRRAEVDMPEAAEGPIKAGDVMAISIRNANMDEISVGACPFALDPDRAERTRNVASYLSFGDGPHRCPGSQVALHEARIFLDRLMRVPGLRMTATPTMLWNENTQGYEIRNFAITCDPIT